MKRKRRARRAGNPVGYAKRLEKAGHDKGRLGEAELESPPHEIKEKAQRLARLLRDASIVVVHTGAGLSTAAGIPDFRGERGVWTLEEQGHPLPDYERCWDNAMPTLAHMALTELVNRGLVHSIISQNVDGLHLRSGIPRDRLCELHGNLFMEMCSGCKREFNRTADVGGVGFQPTGRRCPACGEALVDVLLDWEDELRDYEKAVDLSERCGQPGGLALCLGTSLQISPSKDLPAQAETMAIVNLQKTAKDRRSAVVIRAKIDTVMFHVMKCLGIPIPVYRRVENMVVSHTRTLLSGGRCRWTLVVGDTADGARCGYVESMGVCFPGNSFSEARVTRSPFRLTRLTRYPPGRSTETLVGASSQTVVAAATVPVVFYFTFVAAPGRASPPPKHVEYEMDLSQSEGARTVSVFLGEVKHAQDADAGIGAGIGAGGGSVAKRASNVGGVAGAKCSSFLENSTAAAL
ncbi:unnamed protein product [Ascophyllum nodosum]